MACRACVQILLYVDGIYAGINNQMPKTPHDLIVHLADFDNGRNPEIGTIKKEKGYIFSECCTESFKEKNPVICKWSPIWNVYRRPKGYIFRRNNFHSTEKWCRYMPKNVIWLRQSGYDSSGYKWVLYPVPLQNRRTPTGSRIPVGHCRKFFQKLEPWC